MEGIVVEILQVTVLIALAPLFAGWVKMVKCRLQGRTSPGLLQPYRDLKKLFSKDIVLAENASWIFRFTPYLVFGTVIIAGAVVPILSTDLPLSLTADVIVLVGLFAIARFFTALAGMDIGTAFGGDAYGDIHSIALVQIDVTYAHSRGDFKRRLYSKTVSRVCFLGLCPHCHRRERQDTGGQPGYAS